MEQHVLAVGTLMAITATMWILGHSHIGFILFLLRIITMALMRYVLFDDCLTSVNSWLLAIYRVQYMNVNETQRPGGNLVSAIVQPSWNTSITYRLLGDNSSVTAVFDALVANCSVVNSSSAITAYTPSPSTWPLPEQIIQYYRASTFALSLDGYNNTASLPANMPANNDTAPWPLSQDSPLPAGLNNTFLVCVNTTAGASVPLVDAASNKLSTDQIIEIVSLSILGALVLGCLCCCTSSGCCRNSKPKKDTKAWMRGYVGHLALDKSQKELEAALEKKKYSTSREGWLTRMPTSRNLGYRAIRPDSTNLPEAVKHEERESARNAFTEATDRENRRSSETKPPGYEEAGSISMPGAFGDAVIVPSGPQFPKPVV